MYLGGALVRVHRAEVSQLVPVAVLDQLSLDLRQTPLLLGDYSFSICAAHHSDTTSLSRRRGRCAGIGEVEGSVRSGKWRCWRPIVVRYQAKPERACENEKLIGVSRYSEPESIVG